MWDQGAESPEEKTPDSASGALFSKASRISAARRATPSSRWGEAAPKQIHQRSPGAVSAKEKYFPTGEGAPSGS